MDSIWLMIPKAQIAEVRLLCCLLFLFYYMF
nr:MAG TPA: hypothetical protein [Caudoviricetes sp.]